MFLMQPPDGMRHAQTPLSWQMQTKAENLLFGLGVVKFLSKVVI